MKKFVLAVFITAISIAFVAGPASAGEWNRGRGYIFSPPEGSAAGEHSKVLVHPNDDSSVGPAKSPCSFSGLDDPDVADNGEWALTPAGGHVQSPGQLTAAFKFQPLKGGGCGPGLEE